MRNTTIPIASQLSQKHIPGQSLIKITKAQYGITLIELMVAMAVSSIVMLGISNIYVSTKETSVIHTEFARFQENGRYSLGTMTANIRNAGHYGCVTAVNDIQADKKSFMNMLDLQLPASVDWDFRTAIFGYDADGTDLNDTNVLNTTVESADPTDWEPMGPWSIPAVVNPTLNAAIAARALPGSDIIMIRTLGGSIIPIVEDAGISDEVFILDQTGVQTGVCTQNATNPDLSVDGYNGICPGDIVLASSCKSAKIFQIKDMTGGGPGACISAKGAAVNCISVTHPADTGAATLPGNVTVHPDSAYPSADLWPASELVGAAELMKLVTKTYFVGINTAAVPPVTEPSLYVSINNGTPFQLVEGVENMQILYGVDTTQDGVANQYVSAHNVPDVDGDNSTIFDHVVSVKISYLLRTPEDLPGLNRTVAESALLIYDMGGIAAAPIKIDPVPAGATDRRMRKVVTLVLNLGNR